MAQDIEPNHFATANEGDGRAKYTAGAWNASCTVCNKEEEPAMSQVTGNCILALVLLGALIRSQDAGRSADKQQKSDEFLLDIQPRVIAPGEAALLRWSIKGATKVVIEEASRSGGQLQKIGTFGGSGSLQVRPKEDATYVVSCEGSTTHSCASVSVRVRVKQR